MFWTRFKCLIMLLEFYGWHSYTRFITSSLLSTFLNETRTVFHLAHLRQKHFKSGKSETWTIESKTHQKWKESWQAGVNFGKNVLNLIWWTCCRLWRSSKHSFYMLVKTLFCQALFWFVSHFETLDIFALTFSTLKKFSNSVKVKNAPRCKVIQKFFVVRSTEKDKAKISTVTNLANTLEMVCMT